MVLVVLVPAVVPGGSVVSVVSGWGAWVEGHNLRRDHSVEAISGFGEHLGLFSRQIWKC